MTATITVTNPAPPQARTPLPGPGDVKLGWVPLTGKPPIPRPKWAGGNLAKQKRPR